MRTYFKSNGRECFFLTPTEIDSMMEDELWKANLFPSIENPAVDIEGFITKHLKVYIDQYASLEPSVLGLTEFFTNKRPEIKINKDLTGAMDEDGSKLGIVGRWRATLAHEASHVIIHGAQFALAADQNSLPGFGSNENGKNLNLMRCLKRDFLFRGGSSDEREVQANMGMASLLMPKSLFLKIVKDGMKKLNLVSNKLNLNSKETTALTAHLAEKFQASKQASSIRLQKLNIVFETSGLKMEV